MFLILVKTNFYEMYFKYFTSVKCRDFCEKDVLPVAIFFCMTLKTSVYNGNQRHTINLPKFYQILQ